MARLEDRAESLADLWRPLIHLLAAHSGRARGINRLGRIAVLRPSAGAEEVTLQPRFL
jgi:hypothetical protein